MTEESIFSAALAQPAADRAAFLDVACAGDAALRRRIDVLLAAHGSSRDPLGTGVYVSAAADRPEEAVGAIIAGRYKLLQLIGEGGMGAVYMADQTSPVKRRVAVKVIKAGMDSARVLARFEAERQALALMDHPHIAKVLDAGTTEFVVPPLGGALGADEDRLKAELRTGRPFFVMELVKGIPLTEFCDQHKLPMAARLHLFMQICSAVQHAHQKGIIHRDLKPTNILVESHDGKPVPKVIDFGLAKATSGVLLTDHTLFTALGTVAGTPLYMAPEQAAFNAIDVDTRADIYALGVILYELLTGTTPIERATFKQAAFDEMLRVIREQEPPTPSSRLSSSETKANVAAVRGMEPAKLGRFVKGELDWIVMKALSKERDRRYETANGFAKDVERFLSHEPVQAGPPSARYKLRKFVQRNRPQVIAGSLVMLALCVGMIGTTVGLVLARAARADAVANAAEATSQKLVAEDARHRTREALDAVTEQSVQHLLSRRDQLGESERAFLRNIERYFEEFAASQGETVAARHDRANGHHRLANIRRHLGDEKRAETDYREAVAIAQGLVAESPEEPVHRKNLAAYSNSLATLLADTNRRGEAEEVLQQSLAQWAELIEKDPKDAAVRSALAGGHHNLAAMRVQARRPQEATAALDSALLHQRKLVEDDPNNVGYRKDLANTLTVGGNVWWQMNRLDKAEAAFRSAVEEFDRLGPTGALDPDTRSMGAGFHHNLGTVLGIQSRYADSLREYDVARAESSQLTAKYPLTPRYRSQWARVNHDRGVLLKNMKQLPQAEIAFTEAADILVKLTEQFPKAEEYAQILGLAYHNLGLVAGFQGKAKGSESALRSAIDVRRKLSAAVPGTDFHRQSLGESLMSLASVLRVVAEKSDSWWRVPAVEPRVSAIAAYREAFAAWNSLAGDYPKKSDYPHSATFALHQIAKLHLAVREFAAARLVLAEAVVALAAALAVDATSARSQRAVATQRELMAKALPGAAAAPE